MNNVIPRKEHPKPGFVRENWQNLNGTWEFLFDFSNSGREADYFMPEYPFDKKITVPFCPESRLSGIGYTDFIPAVWYRRKITVKKGDNIVRLHFGAVDYYAYLYVNGKFVGEHKGGYVSFYFDITDYVKDGENTVTLLARDDTRSKNIPSGKQSDKLKSYGCAYTRTTGIWQTVWLEYLPKTHIESVKFTSDIYAPAVTVEAELKGIGELTAEVYFDGKKVGEYKGENMGGTAVFSVALSEKHLWEAGKGNLYDVKFTFGKDTVKSYFGLRQVYFDGMRFMLNGKCVFQRLVLDQGFYPDGIYTAPTDEALENDIKLSLAVGFNGARLHEKVFEERFLYHADRLGYLVWGEYPDWGLDNSYPESVYGILPEWIEEVKRDYNHPAIIGWCPHNETWDLEGRKQFDDAIALIYYATKAIDNTRPCIDTSGLYHVATDIFDLHDYDQNPESFRENCFKLNREGVLHDAWQNRQKYGGQPVFYSEYGGVKLSEDKSGWGYGEAPEDKEEYIERIRKLTKALLDNPLHFGFCYTQLTDVEQEQNGIYYYDRRPKADAKILKEIFGGKAKIEE